VVENSDHGFTVSHHYSDIYIAAYGVYSQNGIYYRRFHLNGTLIDDPVKVFTKINPTVSCIRSAETTCTMQVSGW